jgi:coenzyme F420-0:L-glutamate ligase/coenzyme F420-1:gamma-L-glutamate ligase
VIQIIPVEGLPEIREGDELGALIAAAAAFEDGDVLCVAHKIVSKAEGRVVRLAEVEPSDEARELAGETGDPRRLEVVLRESVRILPRDPDGSAARLRDDLRLRTGRNIGVLITDTFGRAWRVGIANVAIGAAGVDVLRDLRGEYDPNGYELHSTVIALADEIASAAELAMGKTGRIPAAIVRGVAAVGDGTGRDLVMGRDLDLFR